MHECPGGCGREIPESKFLCNFCSDAIPDADIVQIGKLIDGNQTEAAEEHIAAAVAELDN